MIVDASIRSNEVERRKKNRLKESFKDLIIISLIESIAVDLVRKVKRTKKTTITTTKIKR